MTEQELLDAMDSMATEEEAAAMGDILDEMGIDSLDEIGDDDFADLIPEAIVRAKQAMREQELLHAMGRMATEEEAAAMADILDKMGIDSLDDIENDDFAALIPEATVRAKGAMR